MASPTTDPTTTTTTSAAPPTATTDSAAAAGAAAERTSYGVGTRQSPLALAQADIVIGLLQRAFPQHAFPVHAQTTIGDKNQATALHQFDTKALWTTELESALLAHDTDLVVHSLKDMPTALPHGCALGAAVARAEARDCVVLSPAARAAGARTLADLPAGSVVGTSSVRRLAQLAARYPSLRTHDVRGNVGTRLRKLDDPEGPFAALILAATGLQRLGLGGRISAFLSRREGGWLGAVGQGAIGVEVRAGDAATGALCDAAIAQDSNGLRVLWECLAERELLRVLEGGCTVPVAVEAEWTTAVVSNGGNGGSGDGKAAAAAEATVVGEVSAVAPADAVRAAASGAERDHLRLDALVASVDGKKMVERTLVARVASRADAEAAGRELAARLIEGGAGDILREITLNRKIIAEAGGA